ncbi:MAG: undecaprenyl-diphosphatase UppP [Acidobacteriota bacterium]|jgi:undecaprenyl-diphosphatase|nr:undecaprenyl-diphosphatase UppP [Bryobacteraceae bacterium CoA2 C42]
MPIYQAIVLAILQGLTEFLPVSSSAHLAMAPWLLGWKDQGLEFDVALHLGTLLSVIVYFFRDWMQILGQAAGFETGKDFQLRRNPRLLWYLAAGSVPVALAGLLFKGAVETTLRSPYVVGVMAILIGLVMYWAERISTARRDLGEVTLTDCLYIGSAQALAIVPGTSRSGVTLAAGLFRHLDRAAAARFSFLLSTPAVGAAAMKALLDLRRHGMAEEMVAPMVIGISVSAVTGLAVIAFFLRFLRTNSIRPFVIYRVAFGLVVLGLALAGR